MSTKLRFLCCTILFTFACSKEGSGPSVELELVADGLVHPITVVEAPDESGRLFVVDQVGQIWVLGPDGKKFPEPFLDVSDQLVDLDSGYDERGLLGLAFHPNYPDDGRFYVYYTAPLQEQGPAGFDHTNIVAEYRVMQDDPDRADVASERRLLEIDHPAMNHNAGNLLFGPDGMLYIAIGDGGGRDDEGKGHVEDWYDVNAGGNGQDIEQNLLGSILRIDVEPWGDAAYGIPEDNPFADVPSVQGEIWAYGLRNPYGITIDPGGSRALIAADVGQERYEEINVITAGSNYGWNVREGLSCFDTKSPLKPLASCPSVVGPGHPAAGDPLVAPVLEAKNTIAFPKEGVGFAAIGGVVNRGDSLPSTYFGRYLFGMWSSGALQPGGRLFVATMSSEPTWAWEPLRLAGAPDGQLDAFLLGFGQDADGDVYVLTSEAVGPTGDSGKVYRLVGAD
jgi:glucose/arabinose dehydrogenase